MIFKEVAPLSTYVKPKIPNRLQKNIINIIFKIMHLVLGIDLGFFNYESLKYKILFKFLSFIECVVCCSLCGASIINEENNANLMWFIVILLQHVANNMIFIFVPSDMPFKKCLDELKEIDLKLKINTASLKTELRILIAMLIPLLYIFFIGFTFCLQYDLLCVHPVYIAFLLYFVIFGTNAVIILNSLLFYFAYRRLKEITNIVKFDSDIVLYHNTYKVLVDLVETGKKSFDLLFILNILFSVPQVTISLTYSVYIIKEKAVSITFVDLIVECLEILQTLIVMLAPAVYAAMMTTQAEQLKIALYNRLLLENDMVRSEAIKSFVAYIEARPCQFCVYHVVPLNWNLPAIVLNICITYFIVIIQLTHLY